MLKLVFVLLPKYDLRGNESLIKKAFKKAQKGAKMDETTTLVIENMIYNDSYYYFEKNLFGDVLRVYNSSGTTVANFTYDSYGKRKMDHHRTGNTY